MIFAGVQGLEPRLPGPKPGVLPLDDTPFYGLVLQQRISRVRNNGLKICSKD